MAAALAATVVTGCVATPLPSLPPLPSIALPQLGPRPTAARPVTVRVGGSGGDVAGAKVCAERTGGAETCATSGSDGRATVEIPPGTYAVRAIPPTGSRLAEGVVIADLTEDASVVVTLEGRGSISGTVRDVLGHGIRGAEVCAHGAVTPDVACERTREDGAYTVEVVPAIQKIEVSGPPDGSRFLTQWARGRIGSFEADLIDTRAQDATGVDIVLLQGVVLSGAVTAARDGSPVNEAQVCTYPHSAPLGWDCVRTDKNGRYTALREPGRYWLWTIPPGDRGSRLMYERYDDVLEGREASPVELLADRRIDIDLPEGQLISGLVTTTAGEPVVLALVCIDTPFPTGRICRGTGSDGSYEIATRPQTYVVNVYPPAGSDVVAGFWPDAQPDWTKAGEVRVGRADVQLDIALPRGVRLTGAVRDARGAPVEGATINVVDASGPRFFGDTDIQGHYSIAVLPGAYTVDVFSPRWGASLSVLGQSITVENDVGYEVVLPDAEPERAP